MKSFKTFFLITISSLILIMNPLSKLALAKEGSAESILIHMKTSLAEDDAQICAVPNVAWAAVKEGNKVIILVDASAVTSITRGHGWVRGLFGSKTTALDRAQLPERERKALSEQLEVSLEGVPKNYGEYFYFLKEMGIPIYVNQTMMRLYKIDHDRVDSFANPIPLKKMVELFTSSDKILVY